MRLICVIVPLLTCCLSAGDSFTSGRRIPVETTIASHSGVHAGEASMREFVVTVGGKTAHAVQILFRDPATGVFWTQVVRHPKPLDAAALWKDPFAFYRFAASDNELAAFHLQANFLDATVSDRRAASLADAERVTLDDVRRDVASSWPIADAPLAGPTRVHLDEVFGGSFVYDSEIHPTLIAFAITSVAFHGEEWVVTIRNERGETGRLFFSRAMTFKRAEKGPKESS